MRGDANSLRVPPPAATDAQGGAVGCPHRPGLDGDGAGAAPGMADMPVPDPVFVGLWRAFVAQKELNAALRAQIATLERLVALYERGPEALEPAPPARIVN